MISFLSKQVPRYGRVQSRRIYPAYSRRQCPDPFPPSTHALSLLLVSSSRSEKVRGEGFSFNSLGSIVAVVPVAPVSFRKGEKMSFVRWLAMSIVYLALEKPKTAGQGLLNGICLGG